MKKIIYTLLTNIIFSLILILSASEAKEDTCLTLFWRTDSTFRNPDSVYVDTCNWTGVRQDFPYDRMWGKKFFYIECKYNIIPRNYLAPADTIIEYTWKDILEKYPLARNEFQSLENRYGNFYFREILPNKPDTTDILTRGFYLRFDSVVKILEVDSILSTFTSIKSHFFTSWPGKLDNVPNDDNQLIILYPNPTQSEIKIQINNYLIRQDNILKIFNLNGKEITGYKIEYNSKQVRIDISTLTSGIYYIYFINKIYSFIVEK